MTNTRGGSRVWLITGTSSGFGRYLAEAVLAHRDCLVATAPPHEQAVSRLFVTN